MNEQEREMDLALAECEAENRLLRARNERLEKEREWVEMDWDDFESVLKLANSKGMELWEMFKALETRIKEKNT